MAVAAKKKPEASFEIEVVSIVKGLARFLILGTSPLIFNAVSDKARRELLLPAGRKTVADRAQSLKHEPMSEYRNSTYRHRENDHPTRLYMPAPAFKGTMRTAALDMPGTKKTEIGRLVWVPGQKINIFGVPQMLMSVVRSSDINRTPDIRTRAILPEWCAVVDVQYVEPKLNMKTIWKLLGAGGILAGVGDWRQEKGSGNHGQFDLVEDGNEQVKRIMKSGGRVAQDAALHEPLYYDLETEELYHWFTEEIERRGRAKEMASAKKPDPKPRGRGKAKETVEA